MKKLIFMAAITFMSIATIAQNKEPRSPQERADRSTKMLQKRLNLSNDQVAKITPINLERATQIDQTRATLQKKKQDQTLDKQSKIALKEQLQGIEKEHYTKLSGVLSPSQKQNYDKLIAKMKEKAQKKRSQNAQNRGKKGSKDKKGTDKSDNDNDQEIGEMDDTDLED